jgi:serine/threonine-protein kinase
MPRGVALRIAVDVCCALEAVHGAKSESSESLGLVHRDVSPHNVLVGIDGRARVTAAMRRGKIGYMAPECIHSGVATPSSDLFAFGAVLWEMLAGRRLFEGDSDVASLERIPARRAPRLSTLVKGLPSLLDVVVAKALAPATIDRFASMQSLRVALEGAARGLIASREDVAAFVASVAVARSSADEHRTELRTAAAAGAARVPVSGMARKNAAPAATSASPLRWFA